MDNQLNGTIIPWGMSSAFIKRRSDVGIAEIRVFPSWMILRIISVNTTSYLLLDGETRIDENTTWSKWQIQNSIIRSTAYNIETYFRNDTRFPTVSFFLLRTIVNTLLIADYTCETICQDTLLLQAILIIIVRDAAW